MERSLKKWRVRTENGREWSGNELGHLLQHLTERRRLLAGLERRGYDPETVRVLLEEGFAERDDISSAERLEELALKGCIFRTRDGEKRLYQAFQFVVGVYEFQLNSLDREFAELFEEYLPHIGLSMAQAKTSQMRVIPLESSVEATPRPAPRRRWRPAPTAGPRPRPARASIRAVHS